MTLRLGIMLPQLGNYDQATDIADAARIAEATGYDSVWAFERFLYPRDQSGAHGFARIPDRPWPQMHAEVADPLITLTTAAAVTRTVEVGTSVLVPGLHLPGRLAKTLAGLDAASAGRLIAGLGSGWSVDEFAATGPRPFAERDDALDEFLDIADAVWSADPVTFENDRYAITRADVGPKPVRTIPVAIGGNGPLALARVARRGDAWMPIALPPGEVRSQLASVRESALAAGRDPAGIGCIFQMFIASFDRVATVGRKPYRGSVSQIVEDVAALVEAGVDHVLFVAAHLASGTTEYLDRIAELHTATRAAGL